MFRKLTDQANITRAIGYKFKNEKLLLQALTRRSTLNEGRQKAEIGDFQRDGGVLHRKKQGAVLLSESLTRANILNSQLPPALPATNVQNNLPTHTK